MSYFTYTRHVTSEELASHNVAKTDAAIKNYLLSEYPTARNIDVEINPTNTYITAEIHQQDYIPNEGQQYKTTSFEEIRKEIEEQFA